MASKCVTSQVSEYYGKTLAHTGDIQSNACMLDWKKIPTHLQNIVKLIHDDVKSRLSSHYFKLCNNYDNAITLWKVLF